MLSRTLGAGALVALAVFSTTGAGSARDFALAPGKTITLALDGTLGPVISGSDPAGLDGDSATVTITVKESLVPYKTTAASASYHIPAGDITVDVNGTDYTSTSRSSMIIKLGGKADLLMLKAKLSILGHAVSVSDTTALQSGSWTSAVLQHPALFSPSPQNISEPASTFTYSVFGETTELGVTGTASNSN
ncbi:MAG TPA: hypothetical protein VKR31_16565 [Rhizomicrobium sp.]|nr:hypothetical protein [Rhizomicrobium sp.]